MSNPDLEQFNGIRFDNVCKRTGEIEIYGQGRTIEEIYKSFTGSIRNTEPMIEQRQSGVKYVTRAFAFNPRSISLDFRQINNTFYINTDLSPRALVDNGWLESLSREIRDNKALMWDTVVLLCVAESENVIYPSGVKFQIYTPVVNAAAVVIAKEQDLVGDGNKILTLHSSGLLQIEEREVYLAGLIKKASDSIFS